MKNLSGCIYRDKIFPTQFLLLLAAYYKGSMIGHLGSINSDRSSWIDHRGPVGQCGRSVIKTTAFHHSCAGCLASTWDCSMAENSEGVYTETQARRVIENDPQLHPRTLVAHPLNTAAALFNYERVWVNLRIRCLMAHREDDWPTHTDRSAMIDPRWPVQDDWSKMTGPRWPVQDDRSKMTGPRWSIQDDRSAVYGRSRSCMNDPKWVFL